MFFDDVVERDEPCQPARRNNFHAIGIFSHFDAPASQSVVAMADRVDQCFAHSKLRVFQHIFPLQPFDDGAHAHLFEDHLPVRSITRASGPLISSRRP